MQDNEKTAPVRPGWMKWMLLVSLALNFAFIGLIAGATLRNDGPGARMPGDPGPGAFGQAYLRALPPQDRREIFRSLKAADALPDRGERRANFEAVLAVLRKDPFDPQALRQAVGRQSQASIALQGAAQAAWLRIVERMGPETRARYAADVEARLRERKGDR